MTQQSDPEHIKEEPGDDPEDVLFNAHYGVRTIELNRSKKLHSLNASMARKVISRLLEWRRSDMANVILISSAGSNAFCSGGDVAALAQLNMSGPDGPEKSRSYFAYEYILDHLIATYTKPYIAYMNGLTLGGGVGLSVHAPIRIATEKTLIAMPETSIGFFPDAGGSFFLPRLEGKIGTYLALTSERLKGVEAFYAGVATHYIDSASLPSLTARLAELQFKDYDDLPTRLEIIDATLAEYDTGLPYDKPMKIAGELRKAIDRCFSYPTVELIIEALEQEAKSRPEEDSIKLWAQQTRQTLHERSPTSLRVALRQMQLGREWSIGETFQREYEMAGKFMHHPDFTEGVAAKLIRKPLTTPIWDPPNLQSVTEQSVDALFAPAVGQQKLQLIKTGVEDYREYPYSMGLPAEKEIEDLVRQGGQTEQTVVKEFLRRYHDRVGVAEKVDEILDRCCARNEEDTLTWSIK